MKDIRFDFISNTIILSRSFYKEAQIYGSAENVKLSEIKRQNPDMKISVHNPERKGKSEYKGISYRYMRAFIAMMDKDNLHNFENTILIYQTLYDNNTTVFQNVRAWFLENYPYHNDMITSFVPQKKTKQKEISTAA